MPQDWLPEGKTEEEVGKQVDKDLLGLAGREVLDYEIETEGESISTLQQAADREAFGQWRETKVEDERKALITERLHGLVQKAKLTPRLQLVAKLYDKPNNEIALALSKVFAKKVKPGAIRALRHDLLQKLREAASQK